MMGMEPPAEAPPPFDSSACVCLRGPCRYYFEAWTHFEHGNAPGSLSRQPRQRRLSCTMQDGVWLELGGDSPVLECNRWDPTEPDDLVQLQMRRDTYYANHPEHDPAQQQQALEEDDDGTTGQPAS